MGYRPSRVARTLRTRRNRVWALIISDVRTGPFLADLVRGVEDIAYRAGYSLFLCKADEDPVKETTTLNWRWPSRWEGLSSPFPASGQTSHPWCERVSR